MAPKHVSETVPQEGDPCDGPQRRAGSCAAGAATKRWLEENREGIAAYNEHVEKHGVFSDSLRKF
ncbi:MAG: type II toxin-antitoxin system CcdA family antitoxin [Steroidobacteraceae bacterium]